VMQHGEASSARRHTGATGTSLGFLNTTILEVAAPLAKCGVNHTEPEQRATQCNDDMVIPDAEPRAAPICWGSNRVAPQRIGQRMLLSHQEEKITPPGPQQPDPCRSAGVARRRSTKPSGNQRDGMLRAVFLFANPVQ
jgi:hypothetical protein